MARFRHSDGFDTEGLQTDVMRFMAIIAFCLIAIMTLVDELDNQVIATIEEPSLPADEADLISENISVSEKLTSGTVEQSPQFDIVLEVERKVSFPDSVFEIPAEQLSTFLEPELSAEPESALDPKLAIETKLEPVLAAAPESVLEQVLTQAPEPDDSTSEIEQPAEKPAAGEPAADEPSLALRFASDASFINLIAASRIALYAHDGDQYLKMTSEFTTEHERPSGELYELMPTSIPRSVTRLMEKDLSEPIYLVALSSGTRADLKRKMMIVGGHGTLVIHQDGHISHEI